MKFLISRKIWVIFVLVFECWKKNYLFFADDHRLKIWRFFITAIFHKSNFFSSSKLFTILFETWNLTFFFIFKNVDSVKNTSFPNRTSHHLLGKNQNLKGEAMINFIGLFSNISSGNFGHAFKIVYIWNLHPIENWHFDNFCGSKIFLEFEISSNRRDECNRFTVWKFSNFSASLILREINFGWFQKV